jgi:hypothetical protein
MKYICLGYIEERKWETMSESERNAMMDECFMLKHPGVKAGPFEIRPAADLTEAVRASERRRARVKEE